MNSLTLQIDGMSCNHCLNAVNRALSALPGVAIREVRIGSARLEFDPGLVAVERIVDAVTDAGYPTRVAA